MNHEYYSTQQSAPHLGQIPVRQNTAHLGHLSVIFTIRGNAATSWGSIMRHTLTTITTVALATLLGLLISCGGDKTVAVTGVKLNKIALNLDKRETATINSTVLPADATNQKVTWSNSHPEYASFNEATGMVTAKETGETRITVTTEDGNKTAICTVRVSTRDINDPNVYVAGHIGTTAMLWKNGNPITLNDNGQALSVFVADNKDVYVGGWIFTGGSFTATIWKNGNAQSLPGADMTVKCVFVSGDDVYAIGDYVEPDRHNPTLWRNGVAEPIFGMILVHSLHVSGNDVYITATNMEGSYIIKNGVAQKLTDIFANSIYVSGSDVYVAGEADTGVTLAPVLWKNGTTRFYDGYNVRVYSLFVSGTNVYIAGNSVRVGTGNVATLWTNGTPQTLPGGETARSVYVHGTDVYVAGAVEHDWSNIPTSGALLWINGEKQVLSDDRYSAALSVFVK